MGKQGKWAGTPDSGRWVPWGGWAPPILWTPSRISTEAWHDASDTSPTNIVESSGAVSQWSDKSGNGNHLVQADGADQPTTNSVTVGGLNALDFNGTSDFMTSSFAGGVISQQNQIYVVAKNDTGTGWGYICDGIDATDRSYSLIRVTSDFFVMGAGADLTGTIADTYGHVFSLDYNSTTSEFFIDGTSDITGDASTGGLAGLTIGARYTDVRWWNGQICEIVVIDGALSLADQQNMEGYLAWKWGLEVNLPSQHPYRFDGSKFGHETLWTPSQIATGAWYDLDDADTITYGSGIEIQTLGDKSGNANNLTNAAVARPDLEPKGWDAIRPAMFFDGDDGLAIATMLGTSESEWLLLLL